MKKAIIVSPYLDHLGGGERYMLSAASALEELGYETYFAWDNLTEINTLAQMLGIELKNPRLDPRIKALYVSRNPLAMYLATRPYDVVLYLSDGSIPLLGGRCNLLHMQVPFHGVKGRSWKNQLKNRLIRHVIVNSKFTKRIIDKEYGLRSIVLYPPVTQVVGRTKKEKIILSVGRFEPSLNTKHQDILIKAFTQLSPKLPGWKLILAGGSSSEEWIATLQKMAAGFPIEIMTNVAYKELTQLYLRATIYWHAAGYGIDEYKNPELTEHFGISTVEALSALCIPLVVPYGGQREIVTDPTFHWETIGELVEKTKQCVKKKKIKRSDTSSYSLIHFKDNLEKLLA